VHRFCQSSNRGDDSARIDQLVERLTGEHALPLAEPEVCCGFGGLTSLAAPEVGEGILDRKLNCIADSGCDTLITNNPGCVIHLRAGAVARGSEHETLHYAEFLAAQLPKQPTSSSPPPISSLLPTLSLPPISSFLRKQEPTNNHHQ